MIDFLLIHFVVVWLSLSKRWLNGYCLYHYQQHPCHVVIHSNHDWMAIIRRPQNQVVLTWNLVSRSHLDRMWQPTTRLEFGLALGVGLSNGFQLPVLPKLSSLPPSLPPSLAFFRVSSDSVFNNFSQLLFQFNSIPFIELQAWTPSRLADSS